MPDRIASGRAIYARNFRVDEAEAEDMLTGRVGADFTREVFEAAGGLGWQSTALTDRDRSIAIIAALLCQNVTDAARDLSLAGTPAWWGRRPRRR